MDKLKARKLLQFVNTPWVLEDLQEYIDARMSQLRDTLEVEKNIDRIRELQGSIQELKKFRTLRDYIIEKAK